MIFSRYAFHFFRFFLLYSRFFSLLHRTCYLEGIVSLLLVWSVYSYVFFLVCFICLLLLLPLFLQIENPPHFANSIQLHLANLSPFQPSKPTHPFHSSNLTQQHRPKPKQKQ